MAATVRNKSPSLKDQLLEKPYLFEFCQAIKIFETLDPEAYTLGKFSDPHKEVVFLKSRVAYSYPPSDLYKIYDQGAHAPYILEVNFLGLGGPNGPLPMPYSDQIIERARHKDLAFQEFLNIFNHRLLSLLYRIRKKYLVTLETVTSENSRLAQVLLSVLGLGTPAYRNRLEVSDRSLLSYGGLIWRNTKSSGAYTTLIADYFSVPCHLQSFEGEWLTLEKQQMTYLEKDNPWTILGSGASLGEKAWTITRSSRVLLGPLTFAQFKDFLPGALGYKRLKSLSHFYMGLDHHVRINLILKKQDVPSLALNGSAALGWSSWLKVTTPPNDDCQVVFL